MATESSGMSATVRRSLVDRTASAFAQAGAQNAGNTSAPGLAAGFAVDDGPVIRRSISVGSHRGRSPRPASTPPPVMEAASFDMSRMPVRDFQRLVDAVVEAIEQRVVDELERRGRRNPGVF
jgi:hypothetical protein